MRMDGDALPARINIGEADHRQHDVNEPPTPG
ncbi:hypothetical protein BH20CHL7_BH20CHL7_15450 [soil metagenome]